MMWNDRARVAVAALALVAPLLAGGRAHADDGVGAASVIPGPVASRPAIEVALGMGASIDDAGMHDAGLSPVPSFYATGGFGRGTFGFEVGVFANSAIGRFRSPNVPVDRLGFDGVLVMRPFADFVPADERYRMRVLRMLALDLGLGYERDSRFSNGAEVVNRFGARVGLHADLPLTPAGARSELRLRFTARRFVGASSSTFPGGDPAPDSRVELFAALAVVF